MFQTIYDISSSNSKYGSKETKNARNGSFSKNLTTENGAIELNIPRDRGSKFEPAIVGKKQTRIDGLDQKIISLYAKGMNGVIAWIPQTSLRATKRSAAI